MASTTPKVTSEALSKIALDPNNLNKGNGPEGQKLIERSIDEVGWGRSMVMSNDNVVLAGNHAMLKAKQQGVEPIVVETDGTRPVIVKRTDISSGDAKAVKLGILDNISSKKNFVLDAERAPLVIEQAGLTIEECGLTVTEVRMPTAPQPPQAPAAQQGGGGGASTKKVFGVMIDCEDEQQQQEVFEELKDQFEKVRLVTL